MRRKLFWARLFHSRVVASMSGRSAYVRKKITETKTGDKSLPRNRAKSTTSSDDNATSSLPSPIQGRTTATSEDNADWWRPNPIDCTFLDWVRRRKGPRLDVAGAFVSVSRFFLSSSIRADFPEPPSEYSRLKVSDVLYSASSM